MDETSWVNALQIQFVTSGDVTKEMHPPGELDSMQVNFNMQLNDIHVYSNMYAHRYVHIDT